MLLLHLLFRQQAVAGDLRVPPDLFEPRQVDPDLRPGRFFDGRLVRLDHSLHKGRDPLLPLLAAQVMPCLQISAQLPVRLMHDGVDPVFVKKERLIPHLGPLPVFVNIFPAVVDRVLRISAVFPVQIDRVGERMPGVLLHLPKARRKDIPPVILIMF